MRRSPSRVHGSFGPTSAPAGGAESATRGETRSPVASVRRVGYAFRVVSPSGSVARRDAQEQSSTRPAGEGAVVITFAGLDALVSELVSRGFYVYGPRVSSGAVLYERITRLTDVARGVRDLQAPGRYAIEEGAVDRVFGYTVPAQSLKPLFHVPVEPIVRLRRSKTGAEVVPIPVLERRVAVVGARACDLAALLIQDRTLLGVDPRYTARRKGLFVINVNCATAGATCFCASMGTGPRALEGYDLCLTELPASAEPEFLVEVGTDAGAELLRGIDSVPASLEARSSPCRAAESARGAMQRRLEVERLPEVLYESLEHPRWDDVAARCLACGNCTMVCPTCFCGAVEEELDATGNELVRSRRWDSCFTSEFSELHGHPVRGEIRSRYRQWLTHKLGGWWHQFDTSGCVGCGRCITFCPTGIDITEEVAALRDPAKGGDGT